jgi:1,4-dihydroxy-2-naphthoate octaprenyltransferase
LSFPGRALAWLRAARAPFFADVVLCVGLGAACAWYEAGTFEAGLFAACVLGVMLLNAGTNLANDYYDHLSGADEANPRPTPFSGGSRAIQRGTFEAKTIRNAAVLSFALAGGLGLLLAWSRGWPVLAFGGFAALSGFFYTAGPLRLGYRGWGELLAGVNVGPVAVLGSYFVQTGSLSWGVLAASLPVGFMSSALLVINEIPDAAPDARVGKRHLVARFGTRFGAWAYLGLVASAYASGAAAAAFGLLPRGTLIALASAPAAFWAFWSVRLRAGSPERLVSALGANVAALLGTGVLLCTGYLATTWMS